MSKIQQLILDFQYFNKINGQQAALQGTHIIGVDLPKDVYESIKGHADIFACTLGDRLVAEPRVYKQLIERGATHVVSGQKTVGSVYPETAHYNALVSSNTFLHAALYTDPVIMHETKHLKRISVNQGYSRCTTLALTESVFLTSDKGVEKALVEAGKLVHFIEGDTIMLKGQRHGFIGGCCGMDMNNKLWTYGRLNGHPFEELIKSVCSDHGIDIIELLDQALEDIGGLLFWQG